VGGRVLDVMRALEKQKGPAAMSVEFMASSGLYLVRKAA